MNSNNNVQFDHLFQESDFTLMNLETWHINHNNHQVSPTEMVQFTNQISSTNCVTSFMDNHLNVPNEMQNGLGGGQVASFDCLQKSDWVDLQQYPGYLFWEQGTDASLGVDDMVATSSNMGTMMLPSFP